MPIQKSARKRTRRQNSEEIEDARATQEVKGQFDDVSDDEKPRPASVRVKNEKKDKGKGKQRAVEAEEEDAKGDGDDDVDNDSDSDVRIDVDDFVDQPLRKDHLTRLKGIAQDWESMRKQISQRCDIYKDVATAMAEAGESDIQNSKVCFRSVFNFVNAKSFFFQALQKLDAGIKEFIDVGVEMSAHSLALDSVYQKIARGEPVVSSQLSGLP